MCRLKNAAFFQVRFFMYIEFACVLSSESGFMYTEKGYFSVEIVALPGNNSAPGNFNFELVFFFVSSSL